MTFYKENCILFDAKDNVGQYVLVSIYDPDDDTKNCIRAVAENPEAIKVGARSYLSTLRMKALRTLVAQGTCPSMKDWDKETIEEWNNLVYQESLCVYEWDAENKEYREFWCPSTADEFNSGWMDYEDYMYYCTHPQDIEDDIE